MAHAVERIGYDAYGDEFKIGVQVRIFNSTLKNAIRAKGWTIDRTAAEIGVEPNTLYQYLRFAKYPNEERRLKIAVLLGVPDDLLFPETIAGLRLQKQPEPIEIGQRDAEEMGLLSRQIDESVDPERIAERGDLRRLLISAMATLRPNERMVLTARFGLDGDTPKTLDEVAAMPLGAAGGTVTRERIRQIETTAIKKLRHPSRTASLRAYA